MPTYTFWLAVATIAVALVISFVIAAGFGWQPFGMFR